MIELIQDWGYWALALGCLLEGETVLILAGFAAHEGHLNPVNVVAIAAVAGFVGDQIFFWLGRRHGPALLARWPRLDAPAERLQRLLERWHAWVIVFVRFAYGLRIAGPVLIGMSGLAGWRFALFNAIGALFWACVVGGVGWLFGEAAQAMLGKLHHIEGWLLLGLALAGFGVWLWRRP